MKKYTGFDKFQKYQIRKGIKENIDVSIYANPNFTWDQMEQIRMALKAGFDVTSWTVELTSLEMENIRLGKNILIEEENTNQNKKVEIDSAENLFIKEMVEVTSTTEELEKNEFEASVNDTVEDEILIVEDNDDDINSIEHLQVDHTDLGIAEGVLLVDVKIDTEDSVEEEISEVVTAHVESTNVELANTETTEVEKIGNKPLPLVLHKSNKKKIKRKAGLIIITCTILLIGIVALINYWPKIQGLTQRLDLELTVDSTEIEKDSQFIAGKYLSTYTQSEDIKLVLPTLDTNELGTFQLVYQISNNYKQIDKILIVNIVDTKAPIISLNAESVTINKSKDTFDCQAYLEGAKDSVDGDLTNEVQCSNSLDIAKDQQTVEYFVFDKSGNKGIVSLIVNFKKEVEVTSTNKPVSTPKPAEVQYIEPTISSNEGPTTYYYEESWSSGGSYEVDSNVTVTFENE